MNGCNATREERVAKPHSLGCRDQIESAILSTESDEILKRYEESQRGSTAGATLKHLHQLNHQCGVKVACLPGGVPAKTSGIDGRKQNVLLCRPSTPTEGRVCSPYKNCAPQNRCNGKPRQHKDVKGSVNSCSLSLCRRSAKLPHTLA